MKEAGIYKITSPSGRIYIGQTRNWGNRKKQYTPSQCIMQRTVYRSMLKYGTINHSFELVYPLPQDISKEDLDNYEIFFIDQFREAGYRLLNIKGGGANGKLPQESIDKMRATILSKEKKQSKEQIESRIKYLRGKKRPVGWCAGKSNPMYGKPGTNIGRCGEKHPLAKIILDTKTGVFYYGIPEASRYCGIKVKTLRRYLNEEYKTEPKNPTSLIYV